VSGILEGVQVVELALYGMVPAAGAVLSDWGADVVKVEHPVTGDPVRGLSAYGVAPGTGGVTYLWEVFNRGKRSVGIDLRNPRGGEVVLQLCERADVVITNFLEPARQRLGIDVDDVRARNPRIIYARGSGHGPDGPDATMGGFDGVSFWARSGVSVAAMPGDYDYPIRLPGPAYGDLQAAMHLAGGVLGALYHRERTGEAVVVDTSLLGSGIWAMQATLAGTAALGTDRLPPLDRVHAPNPIANAYRTSDGRFLQLSMLEGDRYWPDFCRVIGRPELVDDPRFAGMDERAANAEACVAEIDRAFAAHPLSHWCEALATQSGPWSVVQTPAEVIDDAQARVNGYLQDVVYPNGARLPLSAPPVAFDKGRVSFGPAPELGAHTEEVLLELGLTWDDIVALKECGATI
jgi:crotonobetainyl-CoA:carnitine CoA-transferase CaiB-like acyl-CoA transferase